MGRVFKKKQVTKRNAEQDEDVIVPEPKKVRVEEKEPSPEPEEEDVDDEEEDVDDEEGEDDDDNNIIDFDFEAYPPSEDDRDGIMNMLTQTFLRTDIDLKAMAEGIIENAPHGIVLTQAYEEEETEEDYMVYGLCTTLPLNDKKDDAPKFIKDIFAYLLNRAKKGAPSEFYKKIDEIQESNDGNTALFINERLLNFPSIVVPQVFGSVHADVTGFDKAKQYKSVIYIQKLRIAEGSEGGGASSSASSAAKKKGKMGKAEKKRAAAAALANADIEFDNPEDRVLFELKKGSEVHFDYPVHMDVEPGSKFHITEKDGKKWNPFRRLVIMDAERFEAFLKKGSEDVIV
uniref:Protein BCCIP homolog n=1 Tax=Caenorhabditis japonica TaxID=281687 RepID=A0A8R1I8S7_CAEJA